MCLENGCCESLDLVTCLLKIIIDCCIEKCPTKLKESCIFLLRILICFLFDMISLIVLLVQDGLIDDKNVQLFFKVGFPLIYSFFILVSIINIISMKFTKLSNKNSKRVLLLHWFFKIFTLNINIFFIYNNRDLFKENDKNEQFSTTTTSNKTQTSTIQLIIVIYFVIDTLVNIFEIVFVCPITFKRYIKNSVSQN